MINIHCPLSVLFISSFIGILYLDRKTNEGPTERKGHGVKLSGRSTVKQCAWELSHSSLPHCLQLTISTPAAQVSFEGTLTDITELIRSLVTIRDNVNLSTAIFNTDKPMPGSNDWR